MTAGIWLIWSVVWLICGVAELNLAISHRRRYDYEDEPLIGAHKYWFSVSAGAFVLFCILAANGSA